MTKSDAELVEDALWGGAEAFGPIVDRYRDAVYGVALARMGNYHDAEDVAQVVFVEAYQGLGKLKRPEQLSAWLRTMALRCSIDAIRRRRETVVFEDDQVPAPMADEQQRDLCEEVLAAIGKLSRAQAETVTLFYTNGYSVAEVAYMQGVPEGTVKGRLHDARRKLKEDMMDTVERVLKSGKPGKEFGERVLALLSRRGKPPIPPWSTEWKTIGPQLQEIGPNGLEGFRKALSSPHGPTRLFAPLLRDRSRKVRSIVTDALMGFVEHVPLDVAAASLAEERAPYIRKQKSVLVRAIVEGYQPLLHANDWHTRWFTLRGMDRKPGPYREEHVRYLESLLDDPSAFARRTPLRMFWRAPRTPSPERDRAIACAARLLRDPSMRNRSEAAWYLHEFAADQASALAEEALECEKEHEVRRHLLAIVSRDDE